MTPEHTQENRTLQAAKAVAAVMVVFIHCPFPGRFGEAIAALARFGVPLFFAVSGRYLFRGGIPDTPGIRKSVSKRLFRALKLTATVWLSYTLYSFIFRICCGETPSAWFADKFNPGEAFTFFMFNSGKFVYDYSYTFDHMWYLFAWLYVLILLFILAPLVKLLYRPMTVILLAGLFLGLLLQAYYPIRPFDISIRTWYVLRNWLLFGLPFAGLGMWSQDPPFVLPKKAGPALIIAGAVITIAEYLHFGPKEFYLGSLFILLGILVLAGAEETEGTAAAWEPLVFAGRELSADVYFWHIMLLSLLSVAASPISDSAAWQIVKPLVLIAVSFTFALLSRQIKARVFDARTPR